MQAISRCRSLLIFRNSIAFSSTQFAPLHSTSVCNEKRKNKGKSDFNGGQSSSKKHVRLLIRQKRADSKKALWGILSGMSGTSFQPLNSKNHKKNPYGSHSWDADNSSHSKSSSKKDRSKTDSSHAEKIRNHRRRRKLRKGYLSEEEDDDDRSETFFRATFGERSYTWSFNSWTGTYRRSTPGFDWKDSFYGTSDRQQKWKTSSKPDCENEAFNVGLSSDREVLGLPQNGPLKLKDVKNAFHLSALKWHPDKHQGPSQRAAEEKFKLCVNAYKSLCSELSGA